mgnify:CR=1 FL=1
MKTDHESEFEDLQDLAEAVRKTMRRFEKEPEFIELKLMHDKVLAMLDDHEMKLDLAEKMRKHDENYRKY